MNTPSWHASRGVARVERRWVFGFAALVVVLTSIPYLLGFSVQGDSQVYTGFVFGVEDGNSYIAKILSGAFGAWKFISPYTAYPQGGAWIYPFYIWLGKLAASPGCHVQVVDIFPLLAALTSKAQAGAIRVLESLSLERPSTKSMPGLLKGAGVAGKALVVLPARDEALEKSARNLPAVRVLTVQGLNVYDVLNADMLVLTPEGVHTFREVLAP